MFIGLFTSCNCLHKCIVYKSGCRTLYIQGPDGNTVNANIFADFNFRGFGRFSYFRDFNFRGFDSQIFFISTWKFQL